MFNQLSPEYMVRAIGEVLRAAARRDEPASDFDRDQLMSAYSASRHLAVELASYDAVIRRFAGDLAKLAPDRVDAAATDPRALGELLCDLLDEWRADDSEAAAAMRAAACALMRRLADDEVGLLAGGLR